MKRWLYLALVLLLTGCGVQETGETVADVYVQPVKPGPRQISVELPGDAVAPVLENAGEQIYLCGGYEIIIETRDSGDLETTAGKLCGYSLEDLTVVATHQEDADRYEFVWAAAGEGGDRLGRGVILDDGNYHYCMSVLRDSDEKVSQISWDDVFSSFQLA